MKDYKYKDLTDKAIEAFYCVYNELGFGFLESVYQNAFSYELLKRSFMVEAQKEIRRKAFNNNRKQFFK